jgi:hypothetical protein
MNECMSYEMRGCEMSIYRSFQLHAVVTLRSRAVDFYLFEVNQQEKITKVFTCLLISFGQVCTIIIIIMIIILFMEIHWFCLRTFVLPTR